MAKKNSLEKIAIYLIVPCLIALGLYYVMKIQYESVLPVRTVKWQDLSNKNMIITVDEIDEKQFGGIIVKRGDTSIASDAVDLLLIEYGADPKGMDPKNIQQKVDLLLKISSPDFWRKNYAIHPQHYKVRSWIARHKNYLDRIKMVKSSNDMDAFRDISETIKIHNEYEEEILFKFFRDDLKVKLDVLPVLTKEHATINDMAKKIKQEENINVDLLQQYEEKVIDMFKNEEQNVIHIMLNMQHFRYKIYKGYWRCSRYHPHRCAKRFL